MKRIYLFLFIIIFPCTTAIAQVTVSGSTGANATYATLTDASAVTGAFAAINGAGSQAGNNIVITISADIVETGSASLNAGNWTSLTINPTGGAPRQVSGNINGSLINFNGADNVTVDGLNSGGNALTFTNTSGMGGAITLRFANDATNNTIIRCTLLGSSGVTAGTGFATIYFATGPATGNDNNTITQCNISASATGTPRHAIQSVGLSSIIDNSNNTISVNDISDFFNAAATSGGINIGLNNSDWTINDNKLYQTATRTASTANTHNGIIISSGAGYTISNNVIGFANATGTGTTNMIGLTTGSLGGAFPSSFTAGGTPNALRYCGISCAFTAGGTVSSIQNNIIAGIALYTSSGASATNGILCGINITSGNVNIGTVTGNTIGSATGTNSIYAASTTVGAVISGIFCTTANTINIQNNTIGGIDVSGTTATQAAGFKGIDVAGTGTFNVSNNTVGNAIANNIRTGYLLTGGNLSNTATTPTAASGLGGVRGIASSATGATLDISNNIIQGIQVSGTASPYAGISTTGNVATMNINTNQVGNAVTNAVSFPFVTSNTVFAISIFTIAPGTVNINNNSIYGIICAGANSVRGIITSNGAALTTININNNSFTNNVINGAAVSSPMFGINNSSVASILNITGNIIRSNSSTATTGGFTGIENTGAVINTVNITNNQLGNAIGGAVTFSAATTGAINCITNTGAAATAGINMNNNSIDGISCVSTGQVTGINNSSNADQTVNIKDNQLGTVTGTLITFSGVQSSPLLLISNGNTLPFPNSTNSLFIQGNDIRGIVHSVTGTANHQYITCQLISFYQNIIGNTFTNLSVNTTGDVTFITRNGNLQFFNEVTCSGNSIVTGFAKTAAGGLLKFYTSTGVHEESIPMTITGNDFSNITVTGATAITGFSMTDLYHWIKCTGNSFNNITGGSADITIIYLQPNHDLAHGFLTHTCSSNTFSNITGTGAIAAINVEFTDGPLNCSLNTISNLVSSGSGGDVKAIISNPSNSNTSIYDNNMSGLSSTGASANVMGIQAFARGPITNIYGNLIHNLSCSGAGTPLVNGISMGGMAGTYGSVNVYRNKVYDLLQSGPVSSGSPVINGIVFSTGGSVGITVHNNFVADLKATNANLADAIRGISVSSATANMTYNLYYNSVYINAASTGTNFGTTGIYHLTNTTATTAALNMIDNIIVNTSTANGTGVTTAYRRSDATLTNFATTSDYNLFYAGSPSANRLIYYDGTNSDQTLAAYQTRVSPREANSISLMPTFISNTDLHLTAANCGIDGKGKAVAVTIDIDNETRDLATPDIGADEFTASYGPALAGIVSTAVCDNKTVSAVGTNYGTSVCDLIAMVLPSGGAPVAGKINVCVTLDATQQYFNGEPYVKRHFDVEPAVNPATSTATITLYFDDAEFIAYNTLNPVWPKLPTSVLGNADPNRANLRVTQFHGMPTGGLPTTSPGNYTDTRVLINPGPANVFWNGTYWAITFNVTGFSGFYVHSTIYNTPLPITVNYFNGIKQNGDHLLNWKVTCNSTPTATMLLERSTDNRNFNGIYSITATALQCRQPFDHTDMQPAAGINYYRLKMTDANGKITYSSIVSLLNATKGFDIMNIAPNPIVNGNFKLNVSAAQKTLMDIVVTDMQGRIMQKQTVSLVAGFTSIPMNVGNLSAGTYQVVGYTADGKSRVLRFVIQ